VPADAAPAAAPGVASMATSSEEAYRRYLEGVELSRKLFTQEARQSFRKVVALDSTFAMAHYHLAQVAATEEELRLARLSAIRHAKNATAKEQLYIEALRAQQESDPRLFKEAAMKLVDAYPEDKIALTTAADYYQALEGDYAAAAEYVNRVIDIDPLAKLAYNRLAYLYQSLNEFDKSIWAINKYIELAPDEPNPYDTRGDLYAANGRVDEAIESYARSVTIKPDFAEYASVLKLGNMYLFKGNYDKAAEEYRRMFNSQNPTTRARARRRLAALPAARGHLRESIRRVEAAMATDMNEGFKDLQDSHWKSKSMLLSRLGDDAGALAAMKKAHEVDTSPETPFTGLQRAAEFAFVGAAENAQKEFAPYDAHPDELEGFLRVIYNFGKALAFKANGDYATAVSYAERAKNRDWYQLQYELGDIYLDAGQADDAVSTMEPLLKRYDEERAEFWTFPLLHYRLGIAYQEVGRSEDAITQFETFLRLWKDADPELDQPGDARERLAVLKRGL
jgi:tetratricopeptide (TPR) repeat protein